MALERYFRSPSSSAMMAAPSPTALTTGVLQATNQYGRSPTLTLPGISKNTRGFKSRLSQHSSNIGKTAMDRPTPLLP